ncbi:hypothetical protein B0H34DRAFT_859645 [Crassisporium funariophilum]|nr:hypothetical protein B0H34DRAFT_859645 [Crassisporium funariophilum]
MPAVHYDVWCLIASFIPTDMLVKLCSINLAFFDMAMTERYREINIYHLDDESTRRCVLNMGPASLARVRTLNLRPHLLGKNFISPLSQTMLAAESLWRTVRLVHRNAKPPSAAAARILLRNVRGMKNVTSLNIECPEVDDYRGFYDAMPLIEGAWYAHGSHLRSLTLNIPLELYKRVLPPSIKLDSLEELKISLRSPEASTNCKEILSTICLPFIQRHSQTLNRLSVNAQERVDLFDLFLDLNLPHLVGLAISQPIDFPHGVGTLLSKHSPNLRELKLHLSVSRGDPDIPTPSKLFSHPAFDVPLPMLTSLELSLFPWMQALQGVKQILAIMTSTGLQRLHLYVVHISPALFDLLAKRLPNLQYLEIGFDSLVGKEDGKIVPTSDWMTFKDRAASFIAIMEVLIYPEWELRQLVLHRMGSCGGIWEDCKKALVQSLPSVKTFNDLSPSEFVNFPKYTDSTGMMYERTPRGVFFWTP